jgi:hypothetical protein
MRRDRGASALELAGVEAILAREEKGVSRDGLVGEARVVVLA